MCLKPGCALRALVSYGALMRSDLLCDLLSPTLSCTGSCFDNSTLESLPSNSLAQRQEIHSFGRPLNVRRFSRPREKVLQSASFNDGRWICARRAKSCWTLLCRCVPYEDKIFGQIIQDLAAVFRGLLFKAFVEWGCVEFRSAHAVPR